VPLWTNRYNGLGDETGDDGPVAIAVDASGHVIVTGTSKGAYATIQYSGAGESLWTNLYLGPVGGANYANVLAIDASGNVVVTGSSWLDGIPDFATIKYSPTGVPLWTNRYDGPAHDVDEAYGVGVDSSGNVFVTGRSRNGLDSYYEYLTIKYSAAGVPLWTN